MLGERRRDTRPFPSAAASVTIACDPTAVPDGTIGVPAGIAPDPDNVRQLDEYLEEAHAKRGVSRMGVLTDGKRWFLRWRGAGALRTAYPYAFTIYHRRRPTRQPHAPRTLDRLIVLYLFADDCWWVRALRGEGFYRLADVLSAIEQATAARTRRRRRLLLITRRDDLKKLMGGHGVRPRAFTGHEPPPSEPPAGEPPAGEPPSGVPPAGARRLPGVPPAGARRSSRVRMDLVTNAPQPR